MQTANRLVYDQQMVLKSSRRSRGSARVSTGPMEDGIREAGLAGVEEDGQTGI
jgi:hypothetical protein